MEHHAQRLALSGDLESRKLLALNPSLAPEVQRALAKEHDMSNQALIDQDIETIRDATVYSSDGEKIGRVGEVYIGDDSGQPEWVTVRTGLFGARESFVPLEQASFTGDEIRVPYSKEEVKGAPQLEADGEIAPEEEERLFAHYGVGNGSTDSPDRSTSSDAALERELDSREEASADSTGRGDGFLSGDGTSRSQYEALDERGAATGDAVVPGGTGGPSGTQDASTSAATATASDASSGDDAMTRSEEQLQLGTERRESGRARIRKHVVTERVTRDLPVSHEELVIEREPITDANRASATSGPELSEGEHELVLHEEVPVVQKSVQPVERVRLGTQTQHGTESVSTELSKEQIDLDGDSSPGTTGAAGSDAVDASSGGGAGSDATSTRRD